MLEGQILNVLLKIITDRAVKGEILKNSRFLIDQATRYDAPLFFTAGELNYKLYHDLFNNLVDALNRGLPHFSIFGGTKILVERYDQELGAAIHPVFELLSKFPERVSVYFNRTKRVPYHFAFCESEAIKYAIIEDYHRETDLPRSWPVFTSESLKTLSEIRKLILANYDWVKIRGGEIDAKIRMGKIPVENKAGNLSDIDLKDCVFTKQESPSQELQRDEKLISVTEFVKRVGVLENYDPFSTNPITLRPLGVGGSCG